MKFRLIRLLIAILLTVSLINLSRVSECEATGKGFDFRKTKWGMSKKEVMASENLKPSHQEGDVLGYKTKILNKNVLLAYVFLNDKLIRTKYILAERHSNKIDFIQDYKDFVTALKKKYGEPVDEDSYWRNDLYKDNYSSWGTAISMGHLTYQSTWETDSTKIYCTLFGENFEISCAIQYGTKDKDLMNLEKKVKDKKAMDDL